MSYGILVVFRMSLESQTWARAFGLQAFWVGGMVVHQPVTMSSLLTGQAQHM
jgi:hypothetical protein